MNKHNRLIIIILAVGIFSIMNTEMGVSGILPLLTEHFGITITQAGQLVSLFALVVAISGPIMPMILSGINRKVLMLVALGIFTLGNIIFTMTSNFTIALVARAIIAIFHPVFCSLALVVAASGGEERARKDISTIMLGVSAGMILGVPVTSFFANTFSVTIAMVFISAITGISFIATLIFVPSMPVNKKITYGSQLGVLKKPITWISIITVVFLGAAMSPMSSFQTEYMEKVTHISGQLVSILLFIYGIASIFGNLLAGKLISADAMKTATYFPIVAIIVYIAMSLTGNFLVPMIIIMAIFGIIFSVGNNINQYWMTSATPEAPDFANGLYISGCNWGISIGTAASGAFISGLGIRFIGYVGIIFLILTFVFVLVRRGMSKNSSLEEMAN